MRHLRTLFLSTAVVTGLVLAGCGDDDDNQATNTTPDGGEVTLPTETDGGNTPGPDGGDPGDAPNANRFPAYVKSLIDTKTAENDIAEGESVWGAIPDDETPATSAALFPATYFQ